MQCKYSETNCLISSSEDYIDLCHAVTILVMFPVSITVMNAHSHCASMAPDYYFVQPQFGYVSWNGEKSRRPLCDKGI